MGLSDIAAGVEVTAEQHDRGVATVDRTAADLEERLAPHTDELPCDASTAADVVDAYAAGAAVAAAGRVAGIAPVTAAKTLHLLGEPIRPLGPTGRAIVRDWIAGECSRSEALALARTDEVTLALAAYVETHDSLPDARAAVEGVLTVGGDAATRELDALGDAVEAGDDLR